MTCAGPRVALIADVHGATTMLTRALQRCRAEGVDTIALLGDLLDRAEQADRCAMTLSGWDVIGVYGNHEREVALAAAAGDLTLLEPTTRLLSSLRDELTLDEACLTHHVERWGHDDPIARLLERWAPQVERAEHAWLTFTGHTHFRLARDERGPLDVSRGTLALDRNRRYLINPGALLTGQFAIWDRTRDIVRFLHLEE